MKTNPSVKPNCLIAFLTAIALGGFAAQIAPAAPLNATYNVTSGTHMSSEYSGVATITMPTDGGTLTYNIADGGVLVFDGAAFGNNKRAFVTGSVAAGVTSLIQITPTGSTGMVIFENFSFNNHAAVFSTADRTNITLTNAIFRNNRSTTDTHLGGALGLANRYGGQTLLTNVQFLNNGASGAGAIRCLRNSLTINGGLFDGNYATAGSAGAIVTGEKNEASIFLNDVVFENNRSVTMGGALALAASNVISSTNTIFTNNWTAGLGGAIHMDVTKTLDFIITKPGIVEFTGNFAAGLSGAEVPGTSKNDMINDARNTYASSAKASAGGFLYLSTQSSRNISFDISNDSTLVIGSATASNTAYDSIATASVTAPGVIMTKKGDGILILNADNSYTAAPWMISGGKLLLGNSRAKLGGTLITIGSGATFGGQGEILTRATDNTTVTGTVLAQASASIQVGNGNSADRLAMRSDYIVDGNGVNYNYDLGVNNAASLLELDNFTISNAAFTGTINIGALSTGTFTLMTWDNSNITDAYFGSNILFNGAATSPRVSSASTSVSGTTLKLFLSMLNSGNLKWTGASGSQWEAGAEPGSWAGTTANGNVYDYQNLDAVIFDGIADAANTANRAVTIASVGVTVASMTVSGTANYTFDGGAITSSGNLIKTGTGTLTFHNSTNSFDKIQLQQGTLSVAGIANIGGDLAKIDGSTFGSSGSARLLFEETTAISTSAPLDIDNAANHAAIGASAGNTLTVQNASGNRAIKNAGRLDLTNVIFANNTAGALYNTGTLYYNVENTGITTIAGNTVADASKGGFINQASAPAVANINVASGATLVLGGADAAKDGIAGVAGSTINKAGPGDWILKSDSSLYKGALNIQQGRFFLGGAGAIIGGTVNVASGAIAGGAGSFAGKLFVNGGTLQAGALPGATSGQTLSVADLALANASVHFNLYGDNTNDALAIGAISGVSGVNKIDINEFRFGSFVIASGDVAQLDNMDVTIGGYASSGPRQNFSVTATNNTLVLNGDSGPSLDVVWAAAAGMNTWNLSNSNWDKSGTSVTYASWDRVHFTSAAEGEAHTVALGLPMSISDMYVSDGEDYTFTGATGITAKASRQMPNTAFSTGTAGTGKLYKSGAGKLTFQNSAANMFEGGIEWNGGTIAIRSADQLGIGAGADIAILGADTLEANGGANSITLAAPIRFAAAGASLTLVNNSRHVDLAGPISGAGQLVLGGTVALLGNNTYTGATTLSAGAALAISSDANLGDVSAKLALAGNAALRISGSIATTRAIDIGSHNFALEIDNAGELALGAQNAGAGQITGSGTVVLSGKLHAKSAAVLAATTNWNIAPDGRLEITAPQTIATLALNGGIVSLPATQAVALTAGSLSGSGTIAMAVNLSGRNVNTIAITGTASGTHYLDLMPFGAASDPKRVNIPIITYAAGAPIFVSGTYTAGMETYVAATQDGTVSFVSKGISNIGEAVLVTAGVLGMDWHYSLDSLRNRVGEIRSSGIKPALGGNLWVRANAYHLTASREFAGDKFDQDTFEVTAGVDKGLTAEGSTLNIGLFVSTGQTKRDFDLFGDGKTTSVGAGVYATWVHDKLWFADIIIRGDQYRNEFNARLYRAASHAQYNTNAQGASLEIGKRITLGRMFWIEPSAQAAVALLNDVSYDTDEGMRVTIDGAAAAQYRGQIRAGADLGAWLPYLKFGYVESRTQKGCAHVNGNTYTPLYDGGRIEAGAGVSWLVTPAQQVYFDYEYNKADEYKRPWAFNLGYRYSW